MKKKIIIPVAVIVSILILLGAAFGIYFGNYYKTQSPNEVFQSDEHVQVFTNKEYLTFLPTEEQKAGFIFYQGAKVDEKAYAPMLRELAQTGIVCVLVKMPLNFAIFDTDAAEDIVEDFALYNVDWYVGGHSLGGSMAALCANENPHYFKGVVLLASYSTANLTHADVLSVYGNNDKVLNMKKYHDNKVNLPDDFAEVVIEGGNHANFGYYGTQKGDGKADISREEQIAITVDAISSFIIESMNA